MPLKALRDFIQIESSGGIVLFIAAVLALIAENTSWQVYYQQLINLPLGLDMGALSFHKPLLFWINDGLMTLFFLLVGLEIKRELVEGELNSMNKAVLPAIAAVGGMVLPALIYYFINYHHSIMQRGFAIPTATDIAFALGVLSLLGKRIAPALKVFLTALAIFDDIGAILLIAFFYTQHISWVMLGITFVLLCVLCLLNRLSVTILTPYLLIGILMWVCVLPSGVHATLIGIVLGLVIPLKNSKKPRLSPAKHLEHRLHPWVAFFVLPVFAFANAGVSFDGMSLAKLLHPMPLGIVLGLFLGKQLGIFFTTWLAVKCHIAQKPPSIHWLSIYGLSMIAGIGFTMSLFIGTLAFAPLGQTDMALVRMGVMLGSLLSGVLGYVVLRLYHR